jgi:hypothetical protein
LDELGLPCKCFLDGEFAVSGHSQRQEGCFASWIGGTVIYVCLYYQNEFIDRGGPSPKDKCGP